MKSIFFSLILITVIVFGQDRLGTELKPHDGSSFVLVNITGDCESARVQIANYMKTQAYFVPAESTPETTTYAGSHEIGMGNQPSLVFTFTTYVPTPLAGNRAEDDARVLKSYPKTDRPRILANRQAQRAEHEANSCRVSVVQHNTKGDRVGWCPVDDGALPNNSLALQRCQEAFRDDQIATALAAESMYAKSVDLEFKLLGLRGNEGLAKYGGIPPLQFRK
jgi:hypothetical protein